MLYIDVNDVSKEISPTDLAYLTGDKTGLVVDQDRVTHAINNASALVNSRLIGIYETPFILPVDEMIYQITLDLTITNLYEYEYRETFIPVPIIQRKMFALKKLKQIQNGEISLMKGEKYDAGKSIIFNKKSIIDEDYQEEL